MPASAGDLYTCQPPAGSAGVLKSIEAIAVGSSCAGYSWRNRGPAPAGYVKGMALTYARSVCRLHEPDLASAAMIMSAANTGLTSRDAIARYASVFSSLGMPTDVAGSKTLRALYTLGLGLAMRESSGNYCEGWDTSAGSNRASSEAEAGLFQTSYNSVGSSPELAKLYSAYQAHPGWCFLDVFKEGASCSGQGILGGGAGAAYQRFNKACPAFAAEYAMIMLRVNRSHYGPINRREAEVKPACNEMLGKVEAIVEQDPIHVCPDLF